MKPTYFCGFAIDSVILTVARPTLYRGLGEVHHAFTASGPRAGPPTRLPQKDPPAGTLPAPLASAPSTQRHVGQLSMAQVIVFQELKSFLRISIRTWLMDQNPWGKSGVSS